MDARRGDGVVGAPFAAGFLAAAPALWLLGAILLYSRNGQILLPIGWALRCCSNCCSTTVNCCSVGKPGVDYSTGLFTDRLMLVIGDGLPVVDGGGGNAQSVHRAAGRPVLREDASALRVFRGDGWSAFSRRSAYRALAAADWAAACPTTSFCAPARGSAMRLSCACEQAILPVMATHMRAFDGKPPGHYMQTAVHWRITTVSAGVISTRTIEKMPLPVKRLDRAKVAREWYRVWRYVCHAGALRRAGAG